MREVVGLLTTINETAVRGKAMAALIQKYLMIKTYYPFRPIGDDETLEFPSIYVDPRSQDPEMVAIGKYDLTIDYTIRWYCFDNNPTDVAELCSSIGENLVKLFSNDALGDLQTGNPASKSFLTYPPYWTQVNKNPWQQTPLLPNVVKSRKEKYMRIGRMMITIWDQVIK